MLSPNRHLTRTSAATAARHIARSGRGCRLTRTRAAAVVAAAALLASACSEEPPPAAEETTTTATAAPDAAATPDLAAAPTAPSPCTDPAAQDLGGGPVELDGVVYEVFADACVPRIGPTTTTGATAGEEQELEAMLVVDPVVVPEGVNTFTIRGSNFDPSLTIFLLSCALPDDSLTADASALESIEAEHCDFAGTAEVVTLDSEGSFSVVRDAHAHANFAWVATDAVDPQSAARAAVFVEAQKPEPEPTVTTEPEPTVTTEPEPTVTTEPEPEPTVTTEPEPTVTTEPEPTVTTEPEPTVTTEPEPTVTTEPEPEPTVTTEPEPEPEVTTAVQPISEPLTRCAAPGQRGSGRVAVMVGHAGEGIYSPVVTGGADSCAQIMVWWDALRQAEADRIAAGQYPCEYTAAYMEGPNAQPWTNGPPYLVGCWPQYPLFLSEVTERLSDPAAEAVKLEAERWDKLPPNHPAFVEAVYGCYKMALEGPPPGWEQKGPAWPVVLSCHNVLQVFGRPVRALGLDPVCAARQYTGQMETSLVRFQHFDETGSYADEFSWVVCATEVSRLVPDPQASFAAQCVAVVDVSAAEPSIQPRVTLLADVFGLPVDEFLAEWKSIVCHSPKQEMWTATINGIYTHGDLIAGWTPPEGSICYEAVMLAVARAFLQEDTWIRAAFC